MLELKSVNGVDYLVITIYLVLMALIGLYLSRTNQKTSDYFIGGRQIPWWMAGLSTFISGFSAFVFVAAAGFTYKNGTAGLTIFTSAFWAYWLGYFIYGKMWHRARLSSPMEFLTRRYSPGTTYYYTVLSIIPSIVGLGMAIYILCIFIAIATGISSLTWQFWGINLTGFQLITLAIGVITIIYTAFGGLWAVIITDVVQFLLVMLMSLAILPLSLKYLGGSGGILAGFQKLLHDSPPGYFNLKMSEQSPYFFVAYIFMVLCNYNASWFVGQRYYSVVSERDTQKMAILCSVLSLIGPVIWTLPAMVSRHIFPNIAAYWPNVIEPTETCLVSLTMLILPHGLIGVVIAGILAATMSSTDSVFNYLAAIITKDVYLPLKTQFSHVAPSESQQLWVAKISILVIGLLSIWVALYVPRFGGAFNFGLQFSSLFAPGMILPVFLGLVHTRTPWWSGIAASGLSILLVVSLNLVEIFSGRPMLAYHINVFIGIGATVIVYLISMGFKNKNPEDLARQQAFEQDLKQPVQVPITQKMSPNVMIAYHTIGYCTAIIGGMLLAIGIFQALPTERNLNLFFGSLTLFVGLGLILLTRRKIQRQFPA
ncbi:hypothetical protein L0128_21350 [candidate division KSB1 bacterium]|nr:hypothetical protein [candidate division KSB1 bacterium]